jgi:hypothetical protein
MIAGGFILDKMLVSQTVTMKSPQQATAGPAGKQQPSQQAETATSDEEEQQQELLRKQQELLRKKQEKISNLLKVAEVAIDNYQLTTPSDTSAYFYYQEILKLDPDNQAAQQGLDNIAELYYRLAKNAVDDWNYDRAKQLVSAGLSVRPNETRLLNLKTELSQEDGETKRSIKNSLKDVKGWFN